MSRTTQFFSPRPLVLAGLLSWAGLVAPTTVFAQSVSSERALLNTHAELRGMAILRGEDQRLQIDPAGSQAVTAEQALLGRSATVVSASVEQADPPISSVAQLCPLDSTRALLGQCTAAEAPRREK